jgi:hypothetical protein
MAHHVYANNNEVASKSADGITTAIATDVCISPGPPTPPAGIPVPYPNTAFAKDLARVTKTVLIKRKGAALENYSYFSTSTGDEPATFPLKKGVISGALKGKGYFQQWSMNVKAEGKGVARHVDVVTHNHTNMGNTPGYPYLSVFDKSPACKKDRDKINKNCKTNRKDDNKKKKRRKKKGLFAKASDLIGKVDDLAADAYGYNRKPKNAWIDEYCDGLWVKPMFPGKGKENMFTDFVKGIQDDLKALEQIANASNTELIKSAAGEMLALAKEKFGWWFVVRKAGGFAARSLIKNIIGGVAGSTGVGLVVTGAMGAWTISDAVSTATDIAKQLGPDAADLLKQVTDPDAIRKAAKEKLDQYKNDPQAALADAMTLKARLSKCVNSRKCKLVPYNKTGARDAAKSGEGCCPGQTGHHVIPDAMMKDNPCYKGKGKAPVICLEGTNNNQGSHGRAHSALKGRMDNYRKTTGKSTISYEDARDKAIDAITKPPGTAPASHCSRKCLREQLDAYYKDCKGKQVKATSGTEGNEQNKGLGGDTGGDI